MKGIITKKISHNTSKMSIQILKKYPIPKDILSANKDNLINMLLNSKKDILYAEDKYSKLISTSKSAKIIGIPSSSLFIRLISDINIIENFEIQIKLILSEIQNLLSSSQIPQSIVANIELLQSIPGIGELTATTIISDIKNFTKPKHLVAFSGLGPSVNESGKFKGNNNHISKRGTRIGRRALYAVALASIRCKCNGDSTNSVLPNYYKNNMSVKSKKVGLVAIIHKLMKYNIFSATHSNTDEIRTPLEYHKIYIENVNLKVA